MNKLQFTGKMKAAVKEIQKWIKELKAEDRKQEALQWESVLWHIKQKI